MMVRYGLFGSCAVESIGLCTQSISARARPRTPRLSGLNETFESSKRSPETCWGEPPLRRGWGLTNSSALRPQDKFPPAVWAYIPQLGVAIPAEGALVTADIRLALFLQRAVALFALASHL